MPATEVMIMTFDEGVLVSTICLEGNVAKVALTETDGDGEAVVRAAWERSTSALAGVSDVVRELSVVPSR